MTEPHPFLPNSDVNIVNKMLTEMGLNSTEELFRDIPLELVLQRELNIPLGKNEWRVQRGIEEILATNKTYPEFLCFLGGGIWPHHVPAAVDEIISRAEFYTSYTPYQPEISQGMLQALFEYQSLICDLTGMGVSNSSLYDWPTAAAEAVRMAARVTKRKKVLVARNVGPERLDVIRTYSWPVGIEVETVNFDPKTGAIHTGSFPPLLRHDVAAVYMENPNFFGVMEEEVDELSRLIHGNKSLFIVGIEPISLGLLKPPADYGADIVVGEGQPLGIHMNYGGPSLGLFATRDDPALLRQIPGRIIGATTTMDGTRRGYTMILQTREQHIRRETATSNICTNQALLAVAAASYLALLGPSGLRDLAKEVLLKSRYAVQELSKLPGVKAPFFDATFFKDFTISLPTNNTRNIPNSLLERGILGGFGLGKYFRELSNVHLLSTTEVHSKEDIRALVSALKEVLER